MLDLNLKHGFISNYNETIFLKQEQINGQWVLYYTEPIRHNAHYNPDSNVERRRISLRQCFLHMGERALANPNANNTTPQGQWISLG
jgi:hypothetical protein